MDKIYSSLALTLLSVAGPHLNCDAKNCDYLNITAYLLGYIHLSVTPDLIQTQIWSKLIQIYKKYI